MKPLLILTADKECAATVRGFFEREHFHRALGCGPIQLGESTFDPEKDVLVHPGHDPGVWKDCQQILLTERKAYDKALIILDAAWSGAPRPERLVADIEKLAHRQGKWERDRFEVILIQPELEAWIWQRNIHVAEAFDFPGPEGELWELLALQSLALDKRTKKHYFVPADELAGRAPAWAPAETKPQNPKGVVEALSDYCRSGPASGIFNEISSKVSVARCQDGAFAKLRAALGRWFPRNLEPWEA
jgi:hypothetical protein